MYSLYRILLTVSSAELGLAKSSPSSCEVARFSSRFFGGGNKLFTLANITLLRLFQHIAKYMQLTRNSSRVYVTFGQRHGENTDIFDTL